jgi:hypothetical protein
MTFQAQNIDAIINYFWDTNPMTPRAAEIRRRAMSYLYGLSWFSRNFSSTAMANAKSLQSQYRNALLG